MMARFLTQNPFLLIGILMMVIFAATYSGRHSLRTRTEKLTPTSCRAVRVKLDKNIPANWSTECMENNLVVEIRYPEPRDSPIPKERLQETLFRELANYMKLIALESPDDNLERTDMVTVKLHHPKLTINSLTEGKFLVKLRTMNNPDMIREHLKVTTQVQEVPR